MTYFDCIKIQDFSGLLLMSLELQMTRVTRLSDDLVGGKKETKLVLFVCNATYSRLIHHLSHICFTFGKFIPPFWSNCEFPSAASFFLFFF